jgi:hypothetical protein
MTCLRSKKKRRTSAVLLHTHTARYTPWARARKHAHVHTHTNTCNYTGAFTCCLKMVGPRGDLLSLLLTYSPDSSSVASPSLISSVGESPEETAERSSEKWNGLSVRAHTRMCQQGRAQVCHETKVYVSERPTISANRRFKTSEGLGFRV